MTGSVPTGRSTLLRPSNAFLSFAMLNFTCVSISAAARPAFALSGSLIISTSIVGTICHHTGCVTDSIGEVVLDFGY